MRTAQTTASFVILLAALSVSIAAAQQPPALTPAPQAGASAEPGGSLKAMKRQLAAMQKLVNGLRAQLNADATERQDMQARIESLRREVEAAKAGVRALQNNSVLDLNGYVSFDNSTGYPTVLFNGINVQVVNGTGATQTVNGLGNLILGYNRPRTTAAVCSMGNYASEAECKAHGGVWARSHKSGSHNLVAGDFNGYSSWGGVVFGMENAITAPYATVLGGAGNRALGDLSAIGGGSLNLTNGMYTSVNGGLSNTATGAFATVGGGNARTALDPHDWTGGGLTRDH